MTHSQKEMGCNILKTIQKFRPSFLTSVLLGLFVFRLAYGLSLEFWEDDELQIFLLGFDFFAHSGWPYFGPDVVHTNQQIAGALQSFLVGGPLFLWPAPESSYLLLNILSFGGLLVLGRWLSRRFTNLPAMWVYLWLMTLPWTLNISTHLYNPSYLMFSSCLFFVACFEVIPAISVGMLNGMAAWFLMGFSVAWSLQLHLSWPLLIPFVLAAFILTREPRTWRQPAYFVAGFALPTLLLVPTILKYGMYEVVAPLLGNSGVNQRNMSDPLTIIARFISFGAYEVPRFLTDREEDRLMYLFSHPWLIPFAVILAVTGVIQPIIILYGIFVKKVPPLVRLLIGLTLVELCVIFMFSTRPPTARNYIILFPVAALAALHGMNFLLVGARHMRVAKILISLAVVYQGLLLIGFFGDRSLYLDRAKVMAAIKTKNIHLVGERRSFSL